MIEPSAGVRKSERDGLIAMLRQFGEAVVRSSHNAPNIPAHIEVMEALSSSRTTIMQLFDAQSARLQELEGALRELVRLKDQQEQMGRLYDAHTKEGPHEYRNLRADYNANKPKAWLAARAVLSEPEEK